MKNQKISQALVKLVGIAHLFLFLCLPFHNHAQECNTSPVITCPQNYFGCPGDPTDPGNTGYATAAPGEASCEEPEISFTDEITTTGPCDGQTLIKRTWLAEYPNNSNPWLFAECTQVILLEDLQAPVFTSCPSDFTVDMGNCSNPTWTIPTATDNCGNFTLTSDFNPGDDFPTGTTMVTYAALDDCDNLSTCHFFVTVVGACCNAAPIIECPNPANICPGDSTDPVDTGTPEVITDPDCGPYTLTFVDEDGTDANCTGIPLIRRTWFVSYDNHPDLIDSCLQRVKFVDNQDPVFTSCPTDIFISESGTCAQEVFWTEPVAVDNCGIKALTSNFEPGDVFPVGTTEVSYWAIDNCGNATGCNFMITIADNCCDNEAPIIECPNNYQTCPLDTDLDPSITGYPTVENNSNCGAFTLEFTDTQLNNDNSCTGHPRILRTWTAYFNDNPSLISTCEQRIIFVDNNNPGIVTNCPEDLFFNEGDDVVWIEPTFSDNCGLSSVTSTHNPGDDFPVGPTTVGYTATDNCGNTTTCTFVVTVEESSNTGLVLECPDDITISCGDNISDYNLVPTYTTSCGACSGSNYINGYVYMGSLNGHKYYCSEAPATWEQANIYAQQLGGHLASISSQEENYLLANFLTIQSAYIGLNDAHQEGNFEWSNGEFVGYTNWYPGQPNDYLEGQDYVEILSNGQWNDQYAYKKLEYIVEIPCVTINQTGGPYISEDLPGGTFTIEFEATDACGNTAACSFDLTIETSISIECPEDVVLTCPYNTNGLIVNWNIPEANSCCSSGYAGDIPGFVYMGGYGGSNYYCTTSPFTWDEGSSICQSNGGHLATINEAGENQFLANVLTIQSAYIGLNDAQQEGTFAWQSGEPVSYTNWYPGQPNNFNGAQDHCEMLSNGQWNDQYYYKKLECICEMPGAITITQIAGPPPGSLFMKGTTTTISYMATDGCGNSATCSFDITIEGNTCDPQGLNSSSCFINAIRFDQYQSTTGNNGGYADLTDHCIPVGPNSSYQIGLQPGCNNKRAYWTIYIDFNQDGDFSDNGEFIAYGNSLGAISGIITLPYNIWNGNVTMRVLMHQNAYATGPCDSNGIGEIEDYCLHVTGGTALPDDQTVVDTRTFTEDPVQLGTEAEDLTIYPNPTANIVYLDNIDLQSIAKVELIDIKGAVAKQVIWNNSDRNHIDLSDQVNGSYILNVYKKDSDQMISKKLIISKE